MPLKYLFKALYKDGSVYVQNPEDNSIKEPGKRSCFYDIDHDQLVGFVLVGQGHEYGVDLRDGHFEIDGNIFFMHEVENKDVDPMTVNTEVKLTNFRLVYFTTNTRSFSSKIENGVMGKPYEVDHKRVFRFGWQAQDSKGKNFQKIMQIQ